MSSYELSHILTDVTPRLAEAVRVHPGYKEFSAETALGSTCCGFATGVLQRYLQEQHDIETRRMIGRPEGIPPHPFTRRRTEHVVLLDDTTDTVIDPSHGQFMNLMGLSWQNFHQGINAPEVVALYPEPAIAMFERTQAREFGEAAGRYALGKRAAIQAELGDNYYVPLADHSDGAIVKAYASIWDIDRYEPFELNKQESATGLYARAYDVMTK